VFATVGLRLTETDVRQTMGLRIDDAVRHWWRRFPWDGMTPAEVERSITGRVAELIVQAGEPMPGSLEAVAICARLSLPVAVCSGSYAVVIEAALRRLGIADAVTTWHSAEWEPLGKPHPGAYLSTAAKLGIDPAGCLAKLNGRSRVGANIGRLPVGWWPEQRRLFTPPSRPAEAWRGQLARSVRQKNLNNPGRVALLRPQLTRGR